MIRGRILEGRPRFLLLPASAISEKAILGNRSHCTGATCDISTSNYFSRIMAHSKYALFAHANDTRGVQHLHNVLENSQRPLRSVSLLYVAQYHAIAVRLKVTSPSRNLPAISAFKKKTSQGSYRGAKYQNRVIMPEN